MLHGGSGGGGGAGADMLDCLEKKPFEQQQRNGVEGE